ncbi:TRAPP trafficking subunit Trs65-domain-containing protein, partial [Dissophora ornata]
PIAFIRTKSTNTMLMLSTHVLLRPGDQVVPVAAPVDDQYNLDCFTMVNLLEGLSDDPYFASSAVPQHHYRPDTPRARIQVPPVTPLLRRSVRRTIAVRSALNVRMRTTRVSPTENPLMMSIEVENNSEHGAKFKTNQLDIEVTHAVVTPLDSAELTKLPMVLHSSDHVTFLFSISLLDNPDWVQDSPALGAGPFGPHNRHSSENLAQSASSRDAQRQVTIVLQGTPEVDGVQGQTIHSRWNCFLDVSDLTKRDNSGLAPVHEGMSHHSPVAGLAITGSESGSYDDETVGQSGRPAINGNVMSPGLGLDLAARALDGISQSRAELEAGAGVVVSFAVTDRVVVGKIFNLEIFIVNRSRHIRRYTLVVPNRKRAKGGDPSQGSKVLPPLPSGEQAVVQNVPIDPYMEEPELLRRHVDNETTEADIICLENNVRLSPLYPLTCQNLNLRFIAIKEQLHTIDLVQLVDNDTGFVTNLRNCLCFMAEASFGALSQQVPEVRK